jgi:pimeloyl-ACP methyl ester carboxylesterase
MEMARDAVRLLDHLQISRAHIVGYSLGAIVAARMVSLAPERMMSAAFIGRHPQRPLTPREVEEMDASVGELEGDMPFRSLAVGVQPPGSKPLTDDEIRKLVAPLVAANDVRARGDVSRVSTLVIEDEALSASRGPMLEIIGTEDPNHRATLELQKAHPEIATFIVKGAQHGGEQGILRKPEAISRLREFLSTAR